MKQNITMQKMLMIGLMHQVKSLGLVNALPFWKNKCENSAPDKTSLLELFAKQQLLLWEGIGLCLKQQMEFSAPSRAPLWQRHDLADIYSYGGTGWPIVLISSHINRSYIMDLMQQYSLLQRLRTAGFSPYLIEWRDSGCSINRCIGDMMLPLIAQLNRQHQQPPLLLGYCMGGLLAVAAAALAPSQHLGGIVTINTPWDFHSSDFGYRLTARTSDYIENNWLSGGYISASMIAMMMAWPQLMQLGEKMIRLGEKGEINELSVAVENWLDDGVRMSSAVLKTCLQDWLLDNSPMRGCWEVCGQRISPSALRIPALCVFSEYDKIAPLGSTMPLVQQLAAAQQCRLLTGHLGPVIDPQYNIAGLVQNFLQQMILPLSKTKR